MARGLRGSDARVGKPSESTQTRRRALGGVPLAAPVSAVATAWVWLPETQAAR